MYFYILAINKWNIKFKIYIYYCFEKAYICEQTKDVHDLYLKN